MAGGHTSIAIIQTIIMFHQSISTYVSEEPPHIHNSLNLDNSYRLEMELKLNKQTNASIRNQQEILLFHIQKKTKNKISHLHVKLSILLFHTDYSLFV